MRKKYRCISDTASSFGLKFSYLRTLNFSQREKGGYRGEEMVLHRMKIRTKVAVALDNIEKEQSRLLRQIWG